jgi:hypothetical protein
MLTLSYFLILSSAVIHATWNALAKQIDGNLPALVMAEFLGSIMLFPFIFVQDHPFDSVHEKVSWHYLTASISMHSTYVILLSSAYKYGEVYIIYVLKRLLACFLT